MSTPIVVRSGINRMSIGDDGDLTVADLYERTKVALNLPDTNHLTITVDGESYTYGDCHNDVVEEGSVLEFVKVAGVKGKAKKSKKKK